MKLFDVAQNIMDIYYQNDKADEDFFELEHFSFLCVASYAALLQNDYEKSYAQNRQEGKAAATIPDAWYQSEEVTIEKDGEEYVATLKAPVFTFRYDQQAIGLGYVVLPGGRHAIRISLKELYKLSLAPFTGNLYCWLCGTRKICFQSSVTIPKKVTVLSIPALDFADENAEVPDTLVDAIMKNVHQFMIQGKNGRPFINMTNDQNPNVNPDAEIVSSLRRLLNISPKE